MNVEKKSDNRIIPIGIKNIVFDLGQVLLKYDWASYLISLGYEGEMFEILADAIFRNPDWETGDAGTVTPEEWLDLFIENAPEYEADIRKVFSGIAQTISQFPYTNDLIRRLKKAPKEQAITGTNDQKENTESGYHLYFLSNYSEKLHKDTVHHMDFMKDFDGGIFSYEVKCIKPDLKIYQLLLEKYNLKPEETLFFDDREENINAAKMLGIYAKLFTPEVACGMLGNIETH